MPDALGNDLQRDLEAKMPKIEVGVVAPARGGVGHTWGGGYADRDGMHVTGHAFVADGRERRFRFTPGMIRRLRANSMLDVRLDDEAIKAMGGEYSGKLSSEIDEKNATIKRLEAELARRERSFDGAPIVPEPDAPENLDAGAQLGITREVIRVSEEDPEVKPTKKEAKSGK